MITAREPAARRRPASQQHTATPLPRQPPPPGQTCATHATERPSHLSRTPSGTKAALLRRSGTPRMAPERCFPRDTGHLPGSLLLARALLVLARPSLAGRRGPEAYQRSARSLMTEASGAVQVESRADGGIRAVDGASRGPAGNHHGGIRPWPGRLHAGGVLPRGDCGQLRADGTGRRGWALAGYAVGPGGVCHPPDGSGRPTPARSPARSSWSGSTSARDSTRPRTGC